MSVFPNGLILPQCDSDSFQTQLWPPSFCPKKNPAGSGSCCWTTARHKVDFPSLARPTSFSEPQKEANNFSAEFEKYFFHHFCGKIIILVGLSCSSWQFATCIAALKKFFPPPGTSQSSNNGFYQIKREDDAKRRRKTDADDSPLPRRDVLPGEKLSPRVASTPGDKKPAKKIRVVDKRAEPRIDSPKPKPAPTSTNSKALSAKTTKPFNQLLEGVFFTLSGFQNPLRGQIRDFGLKMGAKYRADWDNSCTHLVIIIFPPLADE